MATLASELWAGRVSLARTFWEYGIAWNIVVAVAVGFLLLGVLSAGAPVLVVAIVYLIAVPYHAFALVAVWRSAGRYAGRPIWARLARAAAVAGTIALVALP